MSVLSIHKYRDFRAQQVPGFSETLRESIGTEAIERIVEIGTGHGGFTAALRRLFPVAEIQTWDIVSHLSEEQRLSLNATFHIAEALTDPQIPSLLQQSGRCLCVCDGGNKIAEVRAFAAYLKPGDLLMAHDYCSTREEFEATMLGKVWNWLEITEADIEDALRQNGLAVKHPELRNIAWGCWEKMQ